RRFGAIVKPQAGRGCERQHRRPDATLVHLFDRPGRSPVRYARIRWDLVHALPLHLSLEIGRRIKVVMGIDQIPLCLTARGRRCQQGCSTDSSEPCEKLASGRMAGCADWAVVEIHGRSPGYLLMERVRPASSARFSPLRLAARKDGQSATSRLTRVDVRSQKSSSLFPPRGGAPTMTSNRSRCSPLSLVSSRSRTGWPPNRDKRNCVGG